MTFRDIELICFAAAAVIHGVQLALIARVWWKAGITSAAAKECFAICAVAFFWQSGNVLRVLSPDLWFVSNAARTSDR